MLKSAANSIAAVIAAALAASFAVVLTSVVPEAKAATLQAPLLQFDDVVKTAPACLLQGWPNYAPRCQFDLRTGNTESRIVRVIALR